MVAKLDVDSLRALKAVADHGGVTKASRYLSLSQSAVSHKIKRLEDSIDCVLLSRRAGASLLTQAGERLLGYANRILSLHDEAVASLSKRALVGNIRLGMTEDMSSSGLARILARFARLFPDVSVRTHVNQSMILQDELADGLIDLGVMQVFSEDLRQSDSVLYQCHLRWVKSQDYQLPADGPVPFLAYDDHCLYKDWLYDYVDLADQLFQTVLKCPNNAGIIAGVEAGLGVSILNERHISPTMVTLLDDKFKSPPDIAYIVRLSSKTKSNAVKVLAEEITRETIDIAHLRVA